MRIGIIVPAMELEGETAEFAEIVMD